MPCMLYTKTLVWRNLPALFLLILPGTSQPFVDPAVLTRVLGSAHACWVLATYQDRLPPLEKSSFSTSTSNPTATSIQMPHLMEPTPQRVASGYQTGELPTTLEAHPVVLNLSPMPVVSTGAVGNAAYSPVDLG